MNVKRGTVEKVGQVSGHKLAAGCIYKQHSLRAAEVRHFGLVRTGQTCPLEGIVTLRAREALEITIISSFSP